MGGYVRSLGWHRGLNVSFPRANYKVWIRNSNCALECYENPCGKCLCYASCIGCCIMKCINKRHTQKGISSVYEVRYHPTEVFEMIAPRFGRRASSSSSWDLQRSSCATFSGKRAETLAGVVRGLRGPSTSFPPSSLRIRSCAGALSLIRSTTVLVGRREFSHFSYGLRQKKGELAGHCRFRLLPIGICFNYLCIYIYYVHAQDCVAELPSGLLGICIPSRSQKRRPPFAAAVSKKLFIDFRILKS